MFKAIQFNTVTELADITAAFDPSLVYPYTPPQGSVLTAATTLANGQLVSLINVGGTIEATLANASASCSLGAFPADGFVLATFMTGQQATVFLEGLFVATVPNATAANVGQLVYLSDGSAGGVSLSPPTANPWQPNTVYSVNTIISDSNSNWQTVVSPGTSGSTQPTWNTVCGGLTFDGTAQNTFVLTSVVPTAGSPPPGTAVYNGAITGGAGNAFAGIYFVISGWSHAGNNGTFICTASTAASLTFQNPSAVAETAGQGSPPTAPTAQNFLTWQMAPAHFEQVVGQIVYFNPNTGQSTIIFKPLLNIGDVTSVGLSMPSDFIVGGSPILTSGVISVTRAPQAAHTILMGPTSGPPAIPTWRLITVSDLFGGVNATSSTFLRGDGTWALPPGSSGLVTSINGETGAVTIAGSNGIAVSLAGSPPSIITVSLTVPVAVNLGGTGDTTLTLNGVLYGNGINPVGVTAQGGANTVLTANGGAPSFSTSPTVTNLTATSTVTAAFHEASTQGTAAAPNYSWVASTNTGFFLLSTVGSPPNFGIGISINGVLTVSILDDGIQTPGIILTAITPSLGVGPGQVGLGTTTGFGNGVAATPVTTTTRGTGSGPANPQLVTNYLEINIGGVPFWIPLFQ